MPQFTNWMYTSRSPEYAVQLVPRTQHWSAAGNARTWTGRPSSACSFSSGCGCFAATAGANSLRAWRFTDIQISAISIKTRVWFIQKLHKTIGTLKRICKFTSKYYIVYVIVYFSLIVPSKWFAELGSHLIIWAKIKCEKVCVYKHETFIKIIILW